MLPFSKLIVAAFVLSFAITYPAQAATIDVPCNTESLVNAINTANANSEADTLNLATNCEYIFASASEVNPPAMGDNALPKITTPIVINGNGAKIERSAPPANSFRLFYVDSDGDLALNNVTITGGSSTFGGGIRNYGTLTLTGSTLSDNSAQFGGGVFTTGSGVTLTVTDSTISGNSVHDDGGGSGASGGGIHNGPGGIVTIVDSIVSENTNTYDAGGGIYNNTGTVTVTGSSFFGNSANGSGGAINNYNSGTLTVSNSDFSENDALVGGGGISNRGSSTVTGSSFSGNSADSGGGIANSNDGTVKVTNSTFSDNTADAYGGGIANLSGTLTVSNSTLSNNSADDDGGGIYNFSGGTLTVIGSIFSGNTAVNWGGGILNDTGGTLTVVNSSFTGNSATVDFGAGGGLFNENGGTATMIGSVLTGNKAYYGGGFYNRGTATATNNTIAGNSSTEGGGLYNFNSGTLTVTSNIVWGNSTQTFNSGTLTVTNSIVEGGNTDNGNLASDPLFVNPVSHASAPTPSGDYHLKFGSPALNAGSNAALPPDLDDLDGDGNIFELLPYDRDNTARVKGGLVDMGAYEGAGTELLVNGGFEVDADQNKLPDGWAVKNAAGDKLKCNKPDKAFSHTGVCAFKFKGGLIEKTKLIQNVPIGEVSFAANDRLMLSAFFSGGNAAVKAKFIVKATYTGGTVGKQSVTVGPQQAYTEVTVPDLVLTSGAVEQIKVMVKHKSTAGKLLVDTASLRHALPANTTRSDILPPPTAPDGFRGGN